MELVYRIHAGVGVANGPEEQLHRVEPTSGNHFGVVGEDLVVLVPHTSAPESRQAHGAGSIMHDHSHLCWFVDPHCLDGLLQFSPVRYLLVVHRFAFLRLGRSCYIRLHLGGHVRMNKALLYNQLVRMYNSVI